MFQSVLKVTHQPCVRSILHDKIEIWLLRLWKIIWGGQIYNHPQLVFIVLGNWNALRNRELIHSSCDTKAHGWPDFVSRGELADPSLLKTTQLPVCAHKCSLFYKQREILEDIILFKYTVAQCWRHACYDIYFCCFSFPLWITDPQEVTSRLRSLRVKDVRVWEKSLCIKCGMAEWAWVN